MQYVRSEQGPEKPPKRIAAMETKSVFECSESSNSASRDIADPWNGSKQCYHGLFNFVNEAYDLGYRVNQKSTNITAKQQSGSIQNIVQQQDEFVNRNPTRRTSNGRLEFVPSNGAQENAGRLQQRYLQFSVAPDRFKQVPADHNDAFVGYGVRLN
jgi:ABC-type sulfate transport system substrate-binding protein